MASWPPFKIRRTFVDNITGLQWFGNTTLAPQIGYTRYCDHNHCGLDMLAIKGEPVYAGVFGRIDKIWCPTCNTKNASGEVVPTGQAAVFGPWRVDIRVNGRDGKNYTLIYAHMDGNVDFTHDDIPDVRVGQMVRPDTQIGGVGTDGNGVTHLHFEITDWVYTYNPISFMMPQVQRELVSLAVCFRQEETNLSGVTFVDETSHFLNQPWRICRTAGDTVYTTCPGH